MLSLCYFIVNLFQVLAGGSGYPRWKQTSLLLFLFFVRERDVNERGSSDTGEAVFNSMRVQFPGYGAICEVSHEMRVQFPAREH